MIGIRITEPEDMLASLVQYDSELDEWALSAKNVRALRLEALENAKTRRASKIQLKMEEGV